VAPVSTMDALWLPSGASTSRRSCGCTVGSSSCCLPQRVADRRSPGLPHKSELVQASRHGVKSCAHPVSVLRGQSWSSVRRRPSVARTAGRSKDQEAGASADHGCRSCSVTPLCIERNMEGYAGSQTRRAGVFPDWPPQRCRVLSCIWSDLANLGCNFRLMHNSCVRRRGSG
jgi:hypothetical protein